MPEDDAVDAAKAKLAAAIQEYVDLERPGAYAGEWTVAVHLQSTDLIAENRSEVWTISPDGQSWPLTWGLLTAGLEIEKQDIRPEA